MRSIGLATLALTAAAATGDMRDIDGRAFAPLHPSGRANLIFFVMTDCPVSNAYAPEIQRTCREYRPHGVACSLVYEDVVIDVGGVRHHLEEYGYKGIPAAVDATRAVATTAGASVTPTAVVVDREGGVRYRGRIDNRYADLGRRRQQATEHYLRDALDAVLADQPVPVPETPAIGCHIVPAGVLQRAPSSHSNH